MFADKAERRKPSESVVTYVEPLSSTKGVCGQNSQINGLARSLFADKAEHRKPSEGIVTYVKPLSSTNTVCGQNSQINGAAMVSTGILRYDKRVEPSNL